MKDREPKILYEDNHLVAVLKPHRYLTQGDKTGDFTLMDWVKADLKRRHHKPGNVFLGLLHRLDRSVQGIVLFAKTSKGASRLSESIRNHEVEKTYWALVEENLKGAGKLVHYIVPGEKKTLVLDNPSPEGKKAELNYRALKSGESTSLIEIELITGRKHQIRSQLSHIGHPIVGDAKYGATLTYEDGCIALVAKKLIFPHPITREKICIELNEAEIGF